MINGFVRWAISTQRKVLYIIYTLVVIYIYTYSYMYIYIYIYIFVYTWLYMHIHICVCIKMYINRNPSLLLCFSSFVNYFGDLSIGEHVFNSHHEKAVAVFFRTFRFGTIAPSTFQIHIRWCVHQACLWREFWARWAWFAARMSNQSPPFNILLKWVGWDQKKGILSFPNSNLDSMELQRWVLIY